MDLSHGYITTLNAGDLIPFFYKEVLAGDTWEINTSIVCRAQTMLSPIFSNINIDYYYFFVPFRLAWEHFPEFFGENRSSAWVQPVTYTVPTISSPEGGFLKNTLADYFGWPIGLQWSATDAMAPTIWKPRCYSIIADQWFRDQNVTDPLNIPLGDSNQTGSNGSDYINDCANAGMPFKAAKYHDYFTSCLPSPQKAAQPVSFNLLNDNKAPVTTGATHNVVIPNPDSPNDSYPIIWKNSAFGGSFTTGDHNLYFTVYENGGDGAGKALTSSSSGTGQFVKPANLWADLSDSLGAITVNELRLAFQLQKFYEKQARAGSRLTETLHEMFGVTPQDARLQRSEYLGGKRVPLIVHEVTNTSQSDSDFLGDLGAKLATSDVDGSVFHSFSEPGYLMGVAVIRYPHYYTQGFDRSDLRKKFEDFYWPVFANIGRIVCRYKIAEKIWKAA